MSPPCEDEEDRLEGVVAIASIAQDALARSVSDLVQRGDSLKLSRSEIFAHIWRAAHAAAGITEPRRVFASERRVTPVPFLDEPWYCCAEPMDNQFVSIGALKEVVPKADQFV